MLVVIEVGGGVGWPEEGRVWEYMRNDCSVVSDITRVFFDPHFFETTRSACHLQLTKGSGLRYNNHKYLRLHPAGGSRQRHGGLGRIGIENRDLWF